MKCKVIGCENSSRQRGWCKKHYTRWKRHGDPEKKSNGHVYDYLHDEVMNFEGNYCLLWPFAKNDKGYGQVRINGKVFYAHRLVCEDANGPAPTDLHEATHSCGNGVLGCVTKKHLFWKTHKENMGDKRIHGTEVRGEKVGTSKLSEDDVISIRNIDLSNSKTAALFGISPTQVQRIRAGTRWAWLE